MVYLVLLFVPYRRSLFGPVVGCCRPGCRSPFLGDSLRVVLLFLCREVGFLVTVTLGLKRSLPSPFVAQGIDHSV